MKTPNIKKLKDSGGSGIVNVMKSHDMILAREARSINKVHNPSLRPGQRANHHGFPPPAKQWTSRLEQAMESYGKAKGKH